MATEIYAQWGFGNTALTAAMGVVITTLSILLALVLRRSSTAAARVM